jgi:murein DD-endopeptidase MepM/ murein hydrolase activator NlpD
MRSFLPLSLAAVVVVTVGVARPPLEPVRAASSDLRQEGPARDTGGGVAPSRPDRAAAMRPWSGPDTATAPSPEPAPGPDMPRGDEPAAGPSALRATDPTQMSAPVALRGRWAWPLSPQPSVVRPFLRPATRYGTGHRGVDLAGSTGQAVLAVEAGTVTHVGRIAGRGTVSVLHASGVRSTYQPVDPVVTSGQAVGRGTRLGRLAASGSHCQPACLHLGAVRGEAYLDPLVFLVGGRRVRLLPLGQVPDG